MALTDILNTIQQDTDTQILEVQKAAEQQQGELQSELEKELAAKKQQLLGIFQHKCDKKVAQASWELTSRLQTAVLKKKQALIEQVFSVALEQLAELPEADYVKTVARLLTSLPELSKDAHIASAKGKEELNTKAVKEAGLALDNSKESVDSIGGFIIQTKEMNIDMTFESLIKSYRANSEAEVASILFA